MDWATLQLRKGLTTLIVLDALEEGEQYGYGLRREVWAQTKGLFSFSEGALYPLLHSLQAKHLITGQRRKVAGRVRRYYVITPKGQQALDAFRNEWDALQRVLLAVLYNQNTRPPRPR
jgi:PadR family transcriptional regulator, regulatory protein PadR